MRQFVLIGSVLGLLLLAAWLMDVQRRLQWRANLAGRYPSEVRDALALIDLAAEELIAGRSITDGALGECGVAFTKFYRHLSKRNGTDDNSRFSLADRAAFYLYGVKLAALQHPEHNAWPLKGGLRAGMVKPLRGEIRGTQDAWTQLAFVTPSLLVRDVALAERLYRKLPPALSRIALQWVNETIIGYKDFNHIPSSHRFLQGLGAPPPGIPSASEDPLTSEQRWAISFAVYPSYATDPRAGLADSLPAAVCRLTLSRVWDVNDTESALDLLDGLLEHGHREELAEELELLSSDELDPIRRPFLLESEAELREYGIAAFDLCGLVYIARIAYKAGYIDEPTAWHFILSAAHELHETYRSWSDMGDDYVLGDRYVSVDHQADPNLRANIEWLQQALSSPWRTIEWHQGLASGD